MPATRRDFLNTCSFLTGAAILNSSGQTDAQSVVVDSANTAPKMRKMKSEHRMPAGKKAKWTFISS